MSPFYMSYLIVTMDVRILLMEHNYFYIALKHEAYLMSDLVEFLLERALNNQHIGHFLFWELRADMNKSSSAASLLYGLLLEAYLVAAPEHEIILEHQLILLEKCKATSLDIQKLEIVTRSHQKAKHR